MFGNPLYDPNAPWRAEPASSAQYDWLDDLGIEAPHGLTKGQASDLISSAIEPDSEQIEFLQMHGVTLPATATQLDANRRIAAIVAGSFSKKRGASLGNWAAWLVAALAIVAAVSCNRD
jgi:hypothetical protein